MQTKRPSKFLLLVWGVTLGLTAVWSLVLPFERFLPLGRATDFYIFLIWVLAWALTLIRNKLVEGVFLPGRRKSIGE